MANKIVIKIVRFGNWAKCRLYQMVGTDTGIGFRETVGAEIVDYTTDPSWEQTMVSENIVIFAHVKPEPDGTTRLTHPFRFKFFERIVGCFLFLMLGLTAFAQNEDRSFQGQVINIDQETHLITCYDDNGKMFELSMGPINWNKFGPILKEADYITGEFDSTSDSTYVVTYHVLIVTKIIRPWIVYERKQ